MSEFKCGKCPPENPVKLQRVQYGRLVNGKFVVDSQTELACCFCHTAYSEEQAVATPEPPAEKALHSKKA